MFFFLHKPCRFHFVVHSLFNKNLLLTCESFVQFLNLVCLGVDSLQVFRLRSLFVGVNLTISGTSTQVFDLSIDLMHTEDPFHLDFYPSVHPSSIKFYQGDKPIIKPQHVAILEFLRQETKATYSSFSKCFIEKLLVVL